MRINNNKNKQKSAVITAIILLIVMFITFTFGLSYFEPPLEYGVQINFGYDDVGSNSTIAENTKEVNETNELKNKPKIIDNQQIKEDIITNENAENLPVKETKKIEKKEVEEVKKVVEEKPKPSKETTDALNSLLNGGKTQGNNTGTDGNDAKNGDKGKIDGDINSNKYYGSSGSGDGNYNLSGRSAMSKPKENPDCQEEGIVVVQIQVDRNGNVINAIAGVKGTTNNAACLLKPAKEAALKTKWNKDADAPTIQVGTIIYRFTLTQ